MESERFSVNQGHQILSAIFKEAFMEVAIPIKVVTAQQHTSEENKGIKQGINDHIQSKCTADAEKVYWIPETSST